MDRADRVGSPRTEERRFVGRAKELSALGRAVERACGCQGRIVMLAGSPGIGKTRMAQHVGEQAAAQGIQVLWGRCPEEAGAPPYWPWLQLVRQYVGAQDEATALATVGIAAAHLAVLDVGLATRLPPQPPFEPPSDGAQARFQLFDAITGFWQRAAARQPI